MILTLSAAAASTTACTLKADDAVKSLPSIFSLGPVTVSSSLIKIHRSITRQWERKIQDGTQLWYRFGYSKLTITTSVWSNAEGVTHWLLFEGIRILTGIIRRSWIIISYVFILYIYCQEGTYLTNGPLLASTRIQSVLNPLIFIYIAFELYEASSTGFVGTALRTNAQTPTTLIPFPTFLSSSNLSHLDTLLQLFPTSSSFSTICEHLIQIYCET